MKNKRTLWIIIGIIIMVAFTSSGWIYNIVNKNSQFARSSEIAALQTTFVQQYGDQATIRQLVSPNKVYAALWTDGDGISHVSWNIGGLWVVVYNGEKLNQIPGTP